MIVKEAIDFKRGISSRKSLDIGLGTRSDYFGFGKELVSLKNRQKGYRLWLTEKFANMVLDLDSNRSVISLNEEFKFSGTYGPKNQFKCHFYFKTFFDNRLADKPIYLTMGRGGDYGFDGGQSSSREKMSNRTKDSLTKQLYNHLLKIIDLPDE